MARGRYRTAQRLDLEGTQYMNEPISITRQLHDDIVSVDSLETIRIQFGDKPSEPLSDFIYRTLIRITRLEQETESLRFANKVRDARY